MTTTPTAPLTLTLRCAADLPAAVPQLLHFHPTESAVMLAFGSDVGTFGGRLDLPSDNPAALAAAAEALTGPAVRHHAAKVALLIYTGAENYAHASTVAAYLLAAMTTAGIDVVECLHVAGPDFTVLHPGDHGPTWEPHNAEANPITAACTDRTLTTPAPSRDDYVGRFTPVPPSSPTAVDPIAVVAHRAALTGDEAAMALATGVQLANESAAAVVAAILDGDRRGTILATLDRPTVEPVLTTLADLAQRAAVQHRPQVLALTALAAWLAGDGALAWAALDAEAVDSAALERPRPALSGIVALLVERAVAPQAAWPDLRRRAMEDMDD